MTFCPIIRWTLLVAVLYFAPLPGRADALLFDTSVSSTFRDGQVFVSLVVTNRGDEPAICLSAEAILENQSIRSVTTDVLDPGQAFRASLELGAMPAGLPGSRTITVKVRYSDVAGHSFSALTSVPIVTADINPAERAHSGRIEPVALDDGQGTLRLVLTSQSATSAMIRVSLVLPDEMAATGTATRLTLAAGETQTLQFPLRNLQAVPGSRYQVFAILDSEDELFHRSTAIPGQIIIPAPTARIPRTWAAILLLPLVLILGALQFSHIRRLLHVDPMHRVWTHTTLRHIFPAAVWAVLFGFLLWHFPVTTMLSDTIVTGGDTPAHNYMARHVGEHLFGHGRIVSWAQGWWGGFPMFQYYFALPYVLMAMLDLVMPFNVAFKIVSVLGIFMLPPCAWAFGRLLRLPKPAPIILAIAMIPFLFVRTHTMWGVNVYSTLAGMIANSISFPIMLLFMGSAWRDADDGVFRLRTVFLLALLVSSHFFTSLVAGVTILILPLLWPASGFRRSLRVLTLEALAGGLLMAWWLIPLLAKGQYSMDFGQDWPVRLHSTFPAFAAALIPFAAVALVATIVRRMRALLMIEWMFLLSVILFYGGSGLSSVFDNIRMWPFIFFGLVALAAAGAGCLLRLVRAPSLGVLVVLVAALTWGIDQPNHVRQWMEWNQSGLQGKAFWPVFEKLVLPLDRTPGRLANDLHPDNNALGSSRVFETVPALIHKPILEGGIVNSALGSMFAYYIQSETSRNCAGFPNIVHPTVFNFTNATRHLELFNVKHFIARSPRTRDALAADPRWKHVDNCLRWDLFELTSHDGRYVFIPKNEPVPVTIADSPGGLGWKQAGLDWIYRIEALDQPFILLRPGEIAPERAGPALDEPAYRRSLAALRDGHLPEFTARPLQPASTHAITDESVTDETIRFRTTAIGQPHIVKCSYFPNWKVRGARCVYMVTPCFLLVYPDQPEVELYYGHTVSDNLGRGLSALAAIGLVVLAWRRVRHLPATGKTE